MAEVIDGSAMFLAQPVGTVSCGDVWSTQVDVVDLSTLFFQEKS